MYEEFFELREPPFSPTPDPRFLWLSETHEEGLSALCYAITRRMGFFLLTGEIGTGKTTLLRAALERIPADVDSALVVNTFNHGPLDLLKLIVADFGISGPFQTKADYIIALSSFLLDRFSAGLSTVLIIDEAQDLSAAGLEEVRLLSNLEADSEKLLQTVLTGQPELHQMLARPELRSLSQRIALEDHIEPLRATDVRSYLEHRISVAGGRYETIFAPGAEATFFEFSEGCPRLLNLLAERVLLAAYSRQLRPVPRVLVESKAKEIAAARSVGRNPETPGDRNSMPAFRRYRGRGLR